MNKITETLNALDDVKTAIEEAFASGYSNGRQRTWVDLTDEEFQWCNDENWPMVRVAEMLKEKNNG